MVSAARRVVPVLLAALLSSTASPLADATDRAATSVGAHPSVSITGGTPDRRQTVVDAVERYLAVGLALPDLDVHLHVDGTGCAGKQGRFHANGDIGVVDLCFPGEFLALHELGHAWEHFNIDDQTRARFEALTGATTWRSSEVVWRRRGIEQAANALAHGLLSAPLLPNQDRSVEFARFEFLTGIPSPRLTENVPRST
jgi:hypothetical protein